MGLSKFIIVFVALNISHQSRMSGRGGYGIVEEFRKEQPALNESLGMLLLRNQRIHSLKDHEENKLQSLVFQTIISLKLPPIKMMDVFKETLEFIYENLPKDNFEDLWLLTALHMEPGFECLMEEISLSGYTFRELCALLGEQQYEARLGNLFLNLRLHDFLTKYPTAKATTQASLKQYSIALDQGISFEMLNGLIQHFDGKYRGLIHLPFWTTAVGRLLFRVEKEKSIRIHPGKYLIDVLNDPVTQSWISLAYHKKKPMAMIVMMFLFPEKAERIYKHSGLPDNFKWVFTDNITEWRKEYVSRMNWEEVRWDQITFDAVWHVMKDSDQKENERFDLLMKSLTEDVFHRVFGQSHDQERFLKEYREKGLDCDKPAFFYMKLEQQGYPLDRIPNVVDRELEIRMLEHYKETNRNGWSFIKMVEIMRIYPYSKYISFDRLRAQASELLESVEVELFEFWISNLAEEASKLIGSDVRFEILSNKEFRVYNIYKISQFMVFNDSPTIFYPKLISKLKGEADVKNREFLIEILSRLILKYSNSDIPSLFLKAVKLLLTTSLKDNKNVLDGGSENFTLLLDNFNGIYRLANPLNIFKLSIYKYFQVLDFDDRELDHLWNYFGNYDFTGNFFDDVKSIVDHTNKIHQESI